MREESLIDLAINRLDAMYPGEICTLQNLETNVNIDRLFCIVQNVLAQEGEVEPETIKKLLKLFKKSKLLSLFLKNAHHYKTMSFDYIKIKDEIISNYKELSVNMDLDQNS
jgi:hypothetical protein